ncbi:mucin-5AC-like [Sycon ciliatum]|uniref:mucin-5AC-like n=1 Tax=Sycon ciliatum TaxID=27933 RepID=UPI0031F66867
MALAHDRSEQQHQQSKQANSSGEDDSRRLLHDVEQQAKKIKDLSEANRRLDAENTQLRALLLQHGIEVPALLPAAAKTNGHSPDTPDTYPTNGIDTLPSAQTKSVESTQDTPASPKVTADSSLVVQQTTAGVETTPSAEPEAGQDEADLAPKEAAAAVIGAYHSRNKAVEVTRTSPAPAEPLKSDTSNSVFSSTSSTSSTSLSSAVDALTEGARLHLQLLYNSSKDSLSITVMKALNLASLGVLDFSKIVFQADLVPGRMVSSRSSAVVYSNNLPLNITLSLAVRQTSCKWKKLQVSLWSVTDGTSETCLGKVQVNLMQFYNNPDPDLIETWVTIGGEADDAVFADKAPEKPKSVSSGLSARGSPVRSSLGMTRRHTMTGAEMESSIAKAKTLSQTVIAAQTPRRSSLGLGTPLVVAAPATADDKAHIASERDSQHSRMSAAVMQAARDEARRKSSLGGGGDGVDSSPLTQTGSTAGGHTTGTPAKPSSTITTTSSTVSDPSSSVTPMKAATAVVDANIPDIRALNRSRTGDKSIARSPAPSTSSTSSGGGGAGTAAPSSVSVPSTPVERPPSASTSDKPTAPASAPRVSEAQPKPDTLGRASSMDTLPQDRRHSSSGSGGGSEELRRAIAQNRAAKEVLAALDKEGEQEKKLEKPEDDDEEPEEESQFVRRASFRLKELRSSQRKKPDRLSFKQKQAFFGTASVDIPDAQAKKK